MGSKRGLHGDKSTFNKGVAGTVIPPIVSDHVLSKGRKQVRPQHVVFFDTETKWTDHKDGSQTHRLKLGWGCYINYRNVTTKNRRADWQYFTKQQEFYKWLDSKIRPKRTLYAIGSNVWFDIRITEIDLWLLSNGFRCDRLYDKGLVTIIRYRKGDAAVTFLAIQNFFRLSIDKMGELLGLPKLKVDYRTVTLPALKQYCKRDVEILVRAFTYWLKFIEQRWSGSFGVTIGQQGLNIYRSSFMPIPITIHGDVKVIELERAGYFGGRTEPFFIGRVPAKRIHKLDMNSQYPYVMRKYKYPCRLLDTLPEPSTIDLYSMLDRYGTTAMIRVKLKRPYLAARVLGKTCFPVGEFDTVVSTEAYKRLFRDGAILQVYYAAIYDMGSLFVKYIDHFNKLKEQFNRNGDYLGRVCAKYIMNCLYGKWGQIREELIGVEDVDIDLLENISLITEEGKPCGKIVTYGGIRRWYGEQEHNANHSFVAISAHITENARLELWDAMCMAGSGHYYYCDTDSLFVDGVGKRRMKRRIHADRMGYWKDEGTVKECVLYGPKDYTLDGKATCKGIRADAENLGFGVYRQQKFASFRTFLDGNMKDKYKVVMIRKKLSRQYNKGIVLASGRVDPFTLPL